VQVGHGPRRPAAAGRRGGGIITELTSSAIQWTDVLLLTLLAATAVIIVRMRSLFAAVMLTGIYSFLGASWMLILDAPDVAFTEASVGAGISTILMLGTLALTGRRAKVPVHKPWLPLAVVLFTGAALVYGTLDMPRFGDAQAPIQRYPAPSYVEKTREEIDVPNVVTAVLASYRGYDTLGETTVIFTAGIGVLLLLRGRGRKQKPRKDGP
jgi:multicomponent Na+:H+ antiporter subunit B